MANTSFFTTFAMMMNIQEIVPKVIYLNTIEYPTSAINNTNINTST